jgi:uncharacterized metal-binding protein
MAKERSCCCSTETKTILACSGASNVGQITNEVAKELDEAGEANFFCLAGVGGHVSGMVASVKGADKVVVLDGCPVACAKKTMDAAGIAGYEYLVVTELGIEKKHDFNLAPADVEKTRTAVRAKLGLSVCCG